MMTKKKSQKHWIVACVAIAGLTIMECFALHNGIDGTLFTLIVAAVAGIGGFLIPSPVQK